MFPPSFGKKHLDIRTAITNLDLDEDLDFNESEAQDIQLNPGPGPKSQDSKEKGASTLCSVGERTIIGEQTGRVLFKTILSTGCEEL
jgi:hypothetical protein